MAIARYFEETHPEPPLMGVDAKDKAIVEMWEKRANEEGMLPASELFRNTHPQFAQRGLPGAADSIPAIAELRDRGRARLNRFFLKFDRQLEDNQFVAGERFTVADATTLAAVDFAAWSEVKIPRFLPAPKTLVRRGEPAPQRQGVSVTRRPRSNRAHQRFRYRISFRRLTQSGVAARQRAAKFSSGTAWTRRCLPSSLRRSGPGSRKIR